jgi:DNA-binding LytR/AlgR family response regulator
MKERTEDAQLPQETWALPGTAVTLIIGEREHRFYPLNAETIEYVESDGNYVTIRTRDSRYISRDTIKRLAAELAHLGFVRIERSLLVNIRAVLHLESVGRGAFAFTLTSGDCLHSSPAYRDAILRVLPMRRSSAYRRPAGQSPSPNAG